MKPRILVLDSRRTAEALKFGLWVYGQNSKSACIWRNSGSQTGSTLVASSSFTKTAGVQSFPKPENNVALAIAGSFHGVSGTYYCTPTAPTICASRVATDGFELGTVASATDPTFTVGTTNWTFKPTDPDARLTSTPDANYASYGWWLYKSEDGQDFEAGAFHDYKGTDPTVSLPPAGTARYVGGAAGKYALSSSTGGTNDAGHFTARATLNANFTNNTAATAITGTLDMFTGADGQRRKHPNACSPTHPPSKRS